MSATILQNPPPVAFSEDGIWLALESDEPFGSVAYIEFTITAGPTSGQTIQVNWLGSKTVTYEAGGNDGYGLDWPLQGASTLAQYRDSVEEFLHQREDINEDFFVIRASDSVIRLQAKVTEEFQLSVTHNFTGITITHAEVDGDSLHPNLRALVEVYTDTGLLTSDSRLLKLHSPYDVDSASTWINISDAFSLLKPHLPPASQINPASHPVTIPLGDAVSAYQKYYFRYADKWGIPAVAEKLIRSASFLAVLGSRAGDSRKGQPAGLCHAYTRADGTEFVKPVTDTQPDWIYYLPATNITGAYINVLIEWSDGTTQDFTPYGLSTVNLTAGKIYHLPAGYRQLNIHNQGYLSGSPDNVYAVGYRWRLGPLVDFENYTAEVAFQVYPYASFPWVLLFSNGVGGCETVSLRGKAAHNYDTQSETYQRPRSYQESAARADFDVQRGDFSSFSQRGRASWEFNTGWYPDPFYLNHLKQLGLGDAWLVDTVNRRFLKVIIESLRIETYRDDDTIYSLSITVRAAWEDRDYNL